MCQIKLSSDVVGIDRLRRGGGKGTSKVRFSTLFPLDSIFISVSFSHLKTLKKDALGVISGIGRCRCSYIQFTTDSEFGLIFPHMDGSALSMLYSSDFLLVLLSHRALERIIVGYWNKLEFMLNSCPKQENAQPKQWRPHPRFYVFVVAGYWTNIAQLCGEVRGPSNWLRWWWQG